MKNRIIGGSSSKYDYEPEKFNEDVAITKQKAFEFKQNVTDLIKLSDLYPDTKKWLIIEAMEELSMLEVQK